VVDFMSIFLPAQAGRGNNPKKPFLYKTYFNSFSLNNKTACTTCTNPLHPFK